MLAALTFGAPLAACGGGHKQAASTTLAPTTATTQPTTTTAPPVAPLTGLPETDAARRSRPALVVKIDNAAAALPQVGIGQADVVFEEQVEGGITRFAAIFQSRDADPVGPVRSTRSTDVAIVSMLNHPLYAFSGGNRVFLSQIRAAPIFDVGVDVQPDQYTRMGGRSSSHDEFCKTSSLFALAPKGAGPPQPLFGYRATGAAASGAGGVAGTHLGISFPGSNDPMTTWDWDGASQTWKRGQLGRADNDASGQQIATANVIVQFVPYHNTGLVDTAGSPVPEAALVGSGDAAVFTGGMIIRGHWSKPSSAAVTTYTDAAGQPVLLAPGRAWVELPPTGAITQAS